MLSLASRCSRTAAAAGIGRRPRSVPLARSTASRPSLSLFRCHRARLLSDEASGGGGGLLRRPVRKTVTPQERAELRAARRERATRLLQQQQEGGGQVGDAAAVVGGASSSGAASSTGRKASLVMSSRWVWYLGLGVPTALLVWGFQDENSPPAKFSRLIGLTGLVSGWTDQFAKPSFDKLLPDWSQVRAHAVLAHVALCT